MLRTAGLLLLLGVLHPPCPAAGEEVFRPAERLAGLGDEDFEARERAVASLREWGCRNTAEAEELFFNQWRTHDDPEVRMRCRGLLREVVLAGFRREGKGFVGISMDLVDVPLGESGGFGVRVKEVLAESPAAEAGLMVNDVIVELDGDSWALPGAGDAFKARVMGRRPGDVVRLGVRRLGEEELVEIEVRLARMPAVMERQQLMFGPRIEFSEARRQEEDQYFEHWLRRRTEQFRTARAGREP